MFNFHPSPYPGTVGQFFVQVFLVIGFKKESIGLHVCGATEKKNNAFVWDFIYFQLSFGASNLRVLFVYLLLLLLLFCGKYSILSTIRE